MQLWALLPPAYKEKIILFGSHTIVTGDDPFIDLFTRARNQRAVLKLLDEQNPDCFSGLNQSCSKISLTETKNS